MLFHGLAGDEMVFQVYEKLRESVKTTCPWNFAVFVQQPNGINRFSNQPNGVLRAVGDVLSGHVDLMVAFYSNGVMLKDPGLI